MLDVAAAAQRYSQREAIMMLMPRAAYYAITMPAATRHAVRCRRADAIMRLRSMMQLRLRHYLLPPMPC